jgi:hypothetical protein
MSYSQRIRDHCRFTLHILLLVLMLSAVPIYVTLAQTTTFVDGIVRLEDRSLCWYTNMFFNKEIFPLIEELNANGDVIGPGYLNAANHLGWYSTPLTQTDPPSKLRITCEGLVLEHQLTQAEIDSGHVNDIVLPNRKPRAARMVAKLKNQVILAVPPGSTVSVEVIVSDPDGDTLHYEWGASDGSTTNNNTPYATWTLPNSRGLHFLYALISDGKGGYEEKQLALSTDGGAVPAPDSARVYFPIVQRITQTPPTPAPVKPSDHTPSGNHFLTFSALTHYDLASAEGLGGPQDNRQSACAYYRDLGAVQDCTPDGHPTGYQLTFADWKQYWGFGSPSSNEVTANYANLADLNLQRDMHTLSHPGPRPGGGTGTDVASYVCNSPNPPEDVTLSNTRLGNNLVACVAFEFTVTYNPQTGQPYNNGLPFTKFLTFGPTGGLLLSVNLDGRGEKFIPGACVACHGGSDYDGRYGAYGTQDPNLNSKFIPYDLDNYQFSTLAGFRRADQEEKLRLLNRFVLDTDPYPPTVELINGWYPTPDSDFIGSYIPPGWIGHEALYNAVVEPHCRMCHVAYDPAWTPFDTYANFADVKYYIAGRVCGAPSIERYWYSMPNTKQTFDRFWSSIGGTPGVDAPGLLLDFLITEGATGADGNPVTTCALPSWLP